MHKDVTRKTTNVLSEADEMSLSPRPGGSRGTFIFCRLLAMFVSSDEIL